MTEEPDFLILRAARKQSVPRPPVWLMRQAGRYMPEFRAVRAQVDFLTLCDTAERVVEVSMQPVEQLGVDGAIIFSDLLIPARDMGCDLEYVKGEGPVIHNPIRNEADLRALKTPDPSEASPALGQAIAMLKREVEPKIPVLGFTGAPWTTAAYMIEGGGSRNYIEIKTMMYQAPELFQRLLEHISGVLISYLSYQVKAGARLVQIFDSWAGTLNQADYRRYALPATQQVIQGFKQLHPEVPLILYVGNSGHFLEATAESGADVLSLDWRVDLNDAAERVGEKVAFQGNLDPVRLFSTAEDVEAQTRALIGGFAWKTGHIFNLGHGILPGTPVENVKRLVDTVKSYA
ncbi:uroporphyrinogen decarboxylase [bacterium (Candidatus Blackallbacteria) CG17_big_fil_post_rev_8_21_14_2_50_48_46]|uniref:Uroporphyrinogen decarboxylase n=1 Tax=bacterium (Candidatus Blackallbacteria) CG17_big_fil_post_rev_8_21_14_2_50_48_46 TaxID=2014261 RepID=A0A2M7GA27_9BACT|nr:MAG: uroporphyrinogen decarboxylase [bacterium (Candidatus Blackallbacteria) CG18_big_fil_WC_8_21_14_2_50_49_26]PIW19003.1 MAG: uroporphyrinogen decarboxylase [bacterium (Candidatus Blackallbacteria) CG17_big_fil_post_rev_8_21_14_2_50_48_46]PIW44629.1 MAG: uroporphyrinogen decarboxylase [bacterium (Candidatus Blackallbacteria) CG13_big_fil_rev_8_21_14_2_50_49_14]